MHHGNIPHAKIILHCGLAAAREHNCTEKIQGVSIIVNILKP
jgi:hypothetical protein